MLWGVLIGKNEVKYPISTGNKNNKWRKRYLASFMTNVIFENDSIRARMKKAPKNNGIFPVMFYGKNSRITRILSKE